MIPLIDLQKTISSKLNELKISIYDKVPDNAKLPFIKISDITFRTDGTKSSDRVVANQIIEVWSEYKGKKEASEILESVISKFLDLEEVDINKNNYIYKVKFIDGSVNELTPFYKAYVNVELTID